MELSKEVHGLLERIKKLSRQAQKSESYTDMNIEEKNSILQTLDKSASSEDMLKELIIVEDMDFSDNERWLYTSNNPNIQQYTGDINKWLRYDGDTDSLSQLPIISTEKEIKSDSKKFIDTRTFTRPKKRVSRPSLENFAESYFAQGNNTPMATINNEDLLTVSQTSLPENMVLSGMSMLNSSFQESNVSLSDSGPIHFKLSEPVYNHLDRILAAGTDTIDSFQNMSPPSLMNSLCSSTFTTLMDSGYVNQEIVPTTSDSIDSFTNFNENEDPNIPTNEPPQKSNRSLNDTYTKSADSPYKINKIVSDLPEQMKKNVSDPLEQMKKNVSDPLEQTKRNVSDPLEHMKKIVSDPPEHMKRNVSDPLEQLKRNVSDPLEHMKKIVSDPPERIKSLNSTFDTKHECNIIHPIHNLLPKPEKLSKINDLNDTYDAKNECNNLHSSDLDYLNNTYDKGMKCKSIERLNDTYDATYKNDKNIKISGIRTFSGTNTFTKKKGNLSPSLKSSCPDINRTFKKNCDYSLERTFQKLSDSQPNLTEDIKQTILNQSMELMNPELHFHCNSARSGSADSLDERSSSISNSSKGSGSKILNMADLDTLAKMQEQSLQQVMSTPKPTKNHILLWEGDVLSPIQTRLTEQDYLSDSDQSDICVTARSGYSQRSSKSSKSSEISVKSALNVTRSLPQTSQSHNGFLKPMEVRSMVKPCKSQGTQMPQPVRPKVRVSGLPRPTGSTGIPRPTSRIPAPRPARSLIRPSQRATLKTDWMDGCY